MSPDYTFLGSNSSCSCGFQYGEHLEEDAQGRASVRRLGEYLSEALAHAGPVELFGCWDGDEAAPSSARAMITPQYFTGDAEAFDLEEGWHETVAAQAS